MLAPGEPPILLFIESLTFRRAQMAKLKTTVDKRKCIASGDCVETAPGVFQFDADGKSEVYNQTGAADAVIVSAARGCPVKAITVIDEETGTQLFPPPKK
jgi:ferredoxin